MAESTRSKVDRLLKSTRQNNFNKTIDFASSQRRKVNDWKNKTVKDEAATSQE